MTTLTQRQRQAHPARFLKKDARNQILRLVYGPASARGTPKIDDWQETHNIVQHLFLKARWPKAREQEIIADLERLKPAKAAA